MDRFSLLLPDDDDVVLVDDGDVTSSDFFFGAFEVFNEMLMLVVIGAVCC